MNLDFSGKTAIVTGAAHGFGRAIGLAFARRGASVWACDVIEDELEQAFAGKKSAQQALDAAVERGNRLLRQFERANPDR